MTSCGQETRGKMCLCDKRILSPLDIITIDQCQKEGMDLEQIAAITNRDHKHMVKALALYKLKDPQLINARSRLKSQANNYHVGNRF